MNDNIKLAIIGASYLQEPLIMKAKSMKIETHVFAWKTGDVGEKLADYFYDISIVEKEIILEKCREIGINGICSIASDLAIITVNYVAYHMGLVGNTLESTLMSTNKNKMRECFERNNLPSPKSFLVESISDLDDKTYTYPIIVKPLDRSGSRGITKLSDSRGLVEAIEAAKQVGFIKKALVEEFASGYEYSVEGISWEGEHKILAITKKFTTGSPNFIETGHLEPAPIDQDTYLKIVSVVCKALDSLDIKFGASHSELKVTDAGDINIIEIGGRMGGDFIGSNLVLLSTGYDFVEAVINVALGIKPKFETDVREDFSNYAAVRFVFSEEDSSVYEQIKRENPTILRGHNIQKIQGKITDSSTRFGYYIMVGDDFSIISKYLPNEE